MSDGSEPPDGGPGTAAGPAPEVAAPARTAFRDTRAATATATAAGLVLAFAVALLLPGAAGETVRAAVGRLDVVAGASQVTAAQVRAAAVDAGTGTSSALTLAGAGEFADLRVTVGQTRDLVNQNVAVSWRWIGDDPNASRFDGSVLQADYLQIMQCWGDTVPDRTQCVFGGTSNRSTSFTSTRFVFPAALGASSSFPVDPNEDVALDDEDYVKPGSTEVRVPFDPVAGDLVRYEELDQNQYFGELTTNEIVQARTRPDGTGFETFETTTFRESDGLGCADVVRPGAGGGTPRSCWLVVVPRGETEVDGRPYFDLPNSQLQSSPLSRSNWENRIAFPLEFQPVGRPCPLTSAQRPVGGVETSTLAVLSWQPRLCAGGGTVFSYTKLSDAVVENGLVGEAAGANGLGFLNAPLDSDAVPADRTLVYAPVAVSGVAIAALVERQTPPDAPAEAAARRGERIEDLRLTPRLVAKLLTHSYRSNVNVKAGYLAGNPVSIERDPEFIRLNPEFADLGNERLELRMPTGVSYTTRMLWSWIAADDEARDFVAGVPDPSGMRVNPFYQGLDVPQDVLPKVDPFCDRDPGFPDLPLCQLDLHPYVNDFFEAAQAVVRGASGERTRNVTVNPPVTQSVARQRPGARNLLGLTDTATAERFLLPTVRLRNAAGEFVAPTTASMRAAVEAMAATPGSGVLVPDAEVSRRGAYPLTVVTYAVAAPNQFPAAAARQYADFVRFAAGPGQTPGTAPGSLPAGYAPLSAGQRQAALAAAQRIQDRVGPPAPPAPRPRTTPPPTPPPSLPPDPAADPGPAPVAAPPAAPAAPPTPSPSAVALPTPQQVTVRTPADAPIGGPARYAIVIALVLGAGGLMFAPLLPRVAQRLRR